MNEVITTDLQTLRQNIRDENNKARSAARKSLEHVRNCGAMLIELKARFPHGFFQHELKELGIEQRTANNYMRIASNWKHVSTLNHGVRDALKLLARADDPPASPPAANHTAPPARPAASEVIDAEVIEPAPAIIEDDHQDDHQDDEQPVVDTPPPAISVESPDLFLSIVHQLPELSQGELTELVRIIQTRWLR